MKKKIFLLCLIITLFSLSTAWAENKALIVGIADYGSAQDNLRGPVEEDVSIMKNVAEKMGFTNDQIRILRNKEATKENIIRAVSDWLVNGVNRDDKIFFYFSGHGIRFKRGSQCENALVASDIRSQGLKGLISLVEDIKPLFMKSASRQGLIILDSCFSGPTEEFINKAINISAREKYFGKLWIKSDLDGIKECSNPSNMRTKSVIPVEEDFTALGNRFIILTATSPSEIAFPAIKGGEGSLFTQSVGDITGNSLRLSFIALSEKASDKIKDRFLSEAPEVVRNRYLPHTPQLRGNSKWFGKDIFVFARESYGTTGGSTQDSVGTANDSYELAQRLLAASSFKVRIDADKNSYQFSDKISFTVESEEDGWLNIIEIEPDGNVEVRFPNERKSDGNKIGKGKVITVPGDIGGFRYEAGGKPGGSRVIALVTKERLNLFKEGKGVVQGLFKGFSSDNFGALKKAVTRSIVVKDDVANSFGAGKIDIYVSEK